MARRGVLVSVCVLAVSPVVEGGDVSLGRSAQPSILRADRSEGTWRDLANPWDYFPPSSIGSRQKMLAWAVKIEREAAAAERSLMGHGQRSKADPAGMSAVRSVRVAACGLRQELVYGAHGESLRDRLATLQGALQAEDLARSTDSRIRAWGSVAGADSDRIMEVAGPWPSPPGRGHAGQERRKYGWETEKERKLLLR